MSAVIFLAIRAGDHRSLGSLLERRPALARCVMPEAEAPGGVAGFTALHLAVSVGDLQSARMLIEAGADLEARSGEGRTVLHDSIELGQNAIRDLLLEAGAEIDVCAAAITGRIGRLRELLEGRPELAGERSTGLSPLGWAAYGNQVETAAELLSRGVRPDDGELLCAASVGHVAVGRLLIEHGADPDEVHPGAGGNALHAAASMRYARDSSAFVGMLLEAGADPRIRTRAGRTALEIAEARAASQPDKNFSGVADLLRRALTEPAG